MPDGTEAFGSQLAAFRRMAGLSQEELAGRSGLSNRAIGNLERGRTRWPHPDSVRRLADALGLNEEARRLFIAAAGRRLLPAAGAGAAPASADQTVPACSGQGGGAQVVPRQLPPSVGHFTGREQELAALSALLNPAERSIGAVAISAISGIAGIGKTALAVHWAHQAADRFPDGQLYVNLRDFSRPGRPVPPAAAIRTVLAALQVPDERIPTGLDAQTGLYRSLLWGKRMLVLLDNAWNSAQVRPLLPSALGCLVLATSRNPLTGLVTAEGAFPLRLHALTDTQARDLLTRRLGAARLTAEPRATAEILRRCAGLPLALASAAARAAEYPRLPLATLAENLKAEQVRPDELDLPRPASQYASGLLKVPGHATASGDQGDSGCGGRMPGWASQLLP
jgi:transcriptional regulator with XRE-family HTH domain